MLKQMSKNALGEYTYRNDNAIRTFTHPAVCVKSGMKSFENLLKEAMNDQVHLSDWIGEDVATKFWGEHSVSNTRQKLTFIVEVVYCYLRSKGGRK